MKCEIIRDLLPSYIDELTSGESNWEIKEHLKTCPECKKYLEEMKESLQTPSRIEENKKAIKPFKKVKRTIWKAVGVTVLVCILAFGGYSLYYGRSWKVDSSDVKVEYEKSGDIVTLGFFPKDNNIYLQVEKESKNPDKVTVYAKHKSPLEKPLRVGGYCGYTFIDEDTIMNEENGTPQNLTGEDTLTIEYGDRTEKIKILDLYEGQQFE